MDVIEETLRALPRSDLVLDAGLVCTAALVRKISNEEFRHYQSSQKGKESAPCR